MREAIGSCKEAAQDVDDFKIKVGEVKQPPSLIVVEVLGLMGVCQIFVICEDLDWKEKVMEIISPRLQGADDCKKLSVIDVVIIFHGDKQLGEVRAGMPVTI